MRQVTGRSSNNSDNKASIRLASGGRFFSATTLGSIAQSGDVVVCIDTPRVTLVPTTITSQLSAEQALAITGQAPQSDEVAIFSAPVGDVCAAIAISKSCYTALSEQLGSRLRVTTPLLSTTHNGEHCLVVELAERVCYLRLYNSTLQIAEALEVESVDELIFYVANILDATSTPTTIPIYIIGSQQSAKALKKYYNVICE